MWNGACALYEYVIYAARCRSVPSPGNIHGAGHQLRA
jgi:hypothetical protein